MKSLQSYKLCEAVLEKSWLEINQLIRERPLLYEHEDWKPALGCTSGGGNQLGNCRQKGREEHKLLKNPDYIRMEGLLSGLPKWAAPVSRLVAKEANLRLYLCTLP